MSEALADRCSRFAGPVVQLMGAAIEGAGNPARLPEVVRAVGEVRRIVELGSDGVSDPQFLRWFATAPQTLDAIEQAAERGDGKAAWAAFTDPETGMAGLGQACAGQPGW